MRAFLCVIILYMKIPMTCTEGFFSSANDYFKFALVSPDIQQGEGLYNRPNIYAAIEISSLPEEYVKLWNDYCQPLFVHELCHAFRNFLNKEHELLSVVDHGLTFKNYVAMSDLETEIEVLTLEEYILRNTDSKIFSNKELYDSIRNLNSRTPNRYTEVDLDEKVKIVEKKWYEIGLSRLEEQFHAMINHLKVM